MARTSQPARQPVIENRRARHDYAIEETLECGIRLTGTEIKSVRDGQVSLGEGYVRAVEEPPSLTLFGAHIAEYPPAAGTGRQHDPVRPRALLAHRREIRKLAEQTRSRGVTIVPLKMYFSKGRAKLLVGVARGRKHQDRREAIAKRESDRDIRRTMSRRR
jgi:SsrA-binding protein